MTIDDSLGTTLDGQILDEKEKPRAENTQIPHYLQSSLTNASLSGQLIVSLLGLNLPSQILPLCTEFLSTERISYPSYVSSGVFSEPS